MEEKGAQQLRPFSEKGCKNTGGGVFSKKSVIRKNENWVPEVFEYKELFSVSVGVGPYNKAPNFETAIFKKESSPKKF